MTYAIIRDGVPVEVNGPFADKNGISHPRQVLRLWSDAELAAIDVYPVTEGSVPDGHVVTGSTLTWDGTTVTRVFTSEPAPPPEPDYDAELIGAINAATTLDDLKAALVGNITGAKSRVRGAPK